MFPKQKKKTHTNPKHGPFHFKTPSQVVWKTIRGMLPYKTFRGNDALMRLRLFDGIPSNLIKVKKIVIPCALRIIKLAKGRKFTSIGEIFDEIGWKRKQTLKKKDENQKILGKAYWKKKYQIIKNMKKSKKQLISVLLN